MKTLFDKTELNHLKVKNRLFRSATWDGLVTPDGTLPENVYKIYEQLAMGGVGTIITGLTDVSEKKHRPCRQYAALFRHASSRLSATDFSRPSVRLQHHSAA